MNSLLADEIDQDDDGSYDSQGLPLIKSASCIKYDDRNRLLGYTAYSDMPSAHRPTNDVFQAMKRGMPVNFAALNLTELDQQYNSHATANQNRLG